MSALEFVLAEPTSRCNLTCPLCPTGRGQAARARALLDPEELAALLDSPGVGRPDVLLWGWGEPTLHPGLVDLVRIAHARGCRVEVQSNGHGPVATYHALLDEGLATLTLAMDGSEGPDITLLRGPHADLPRVRAQLLELAPRAFRTQLVVQCLVTRANESRLGEIAAWVRALPAQPVFKTLHVGDAPAALVSELVPDRMAYWRPAALRTRQAGDPRTTCGFLSRGTTVLCDGTVVPCCYDWSAAHPLGRVGDGWEHLSNARDDFRHHEVPPAMCRACAFGPDLTVDPVVVESRS
jgi:MoaA/NifB/PqqE/SkfB family radical SAM enzyme